MNDGGLNMKIICASVLDVGTLFLGILAKEVDPPIQKQPCE